MASPQTGILPLASAHALFITLDLVPTPAALQRVRGVLAAIPGLTQELAQAYPDACLSSVVAIGAGVWEEITECVRPTQLVDFKVRTHGQRKAPSTPSDLLLHIRSERCDLNFELARRILEQANGAVMIREEVAGFRYLDARDLTGFVDGTENPEGDERAEVALVGNEDKQFVGGSYVMLQRYVHDLTHWRELIQEQQEQIIGRTKETDEELSEDIKPATAHISRVVIEEEGEELAILRHSLPYGDNREAGLMFIAYARHREIFDKMLGRMFDQEGEGIHDHLLDYTRAVTGAYYFAPSRTRLEKLVA